MTSIKARIATLQEEVNAARAANAEAVVAGKPKVVSSGTIYKKTRDLDILSLLDRAAYVPTTEEDKEVLGRLTDPGSLGSIEVTEGADLATLLAANADRKDVYAKLLAAADEADLTLVGTTFVKK